MLLLRFDKFYAHLALAYACMRLEPGVKFVTGSQTSS